MGVSGLTLWARANLPEAYVRAPTEAEHVHVDANGLVHEAIRHARTDDAVLSQLAHRLDTLVCRAVRPTRSLALALDGPAPLCKLATQRARRLARVRGGSLHAGPSSLAITPGTPFMARVDGALALWGALALTQRRLPAGVVVVVDPSSSAGEGESKLHARLAALPAHARAEHVHVVVGGDSDLLLLALNAPARRLFVLDTALAPGGSVGGGGKRGGRGGGSAERHVAFSCELARARLSRRGRELRPAPPDGGAEGGGGCLDLALLAVLQGCDYLPRLRGFSLGRAFAVHFGPAAPLGARLVVRDGEGRLALGAPAFCALLHEAFGGGAEAEAEAEAGEAEGEGGEAGVAAYCALALWAVEQIAHGSPPHWYTAWPHAAQPPHARELAASPALVAAARAPRDARPPLPPAACALAMLPAAAARLLPAPLRPLVAPAGPLGRLFEAERCAECAQLRQRLGALQALLEALRAAAGRPGAGAAEAAEEASCRGAMGPAQRAYNEHRARAHADWSAQQMADAVLAAVRGVPPGAFAGEAAPCAHGGRPLEIHLRAPPQPGGVGVGCCAGGCGWARPRAQGRLARQPPDGVCCVELGGECGGADGVGGLFGGGPAAKQATPAPPPARPAWQAPQPQPQLQPLQQARAPPALPPHGCARALSVHAGAPPPPASKSARRRAAKRARALGGCVGPAAFAPAAAAPSDSGHAELECDDDYRPPEYAQWAGVPQRLA